MPIKDLYAKGSPVVSLEVFPPKKDAEIEVIYEALGKMAGLSPDFISVTYGAGGSGGTKTEEIASFILNTCKIEPLAHITCVGANYEETRRALDGFRNKGIKNVLALRGDLPANEARLGSYRYAEELIAEIRARGDFCIGAACYPEGHIDCGSPQLDMDYLLRKQEAGADFLITQLFFDNKLIYRFLEKARKRGVTLPVSAGVMPILGRSQIERMVFMCGVSLPSEIVKLLHKYENNPDDLQSAGIEHAAKQIEELIKHGVDGVHIYTMNRPHIAEYCLKHIGRAR